VDAGVPANLSESLLDDSGESISVDQLLREQMEKFGRRSLASNTRGGYQSDWKDFVGW